MILLPFPAFAGHSYSYSYQLNRGGVTYFPDRIANAQLKKAERRIKNGEDGVCMYM
jgi:hypothetical protein